MARVYIGLGSNMGDRRAYLRTAVIAVARLGGVEVLATSPVVETDPVGGPAGQGKYLNAAVEVETEIPPPELLRRLLAIEDSLGRERAERWGPRTIDLDILLYGDEVIETDELTVPHPRMHERRFVLEPLAAIAPGARHPVTGKTAAGMLAEVGGDG